MDDISSRILQYIEDRFGQTVTKDRGDVLQQIENLMAGASPKADGPRPPTAWVMFARERRPAFRASNPQLNGHQITKLIGAEWAATLGTPTRQEYELKAADAAFQFHKKSVTTVQLTKGTEKLVPKDSDVKREQDEDVEHNTDTEDSESTCTFLNFCHNVRNDVQRKHPDISERRMNRIARQAWDVMSPQQREQFQGSLDE